MRGENMSKLLCTSCSRDAIWRLEAEDARVAWSCDNSEHLRSAIGVVIDGLSEGTINFQVSEDGFSTREAL
jgi:hypothetical protein